MKHILSPGWVIELPSDHPTAQFAAHELRQAIQRMGGPPLPLVGQAHDHRISLRHGAAGDGFVRFADEHGLVLVGEGPTGLLYAVYHLLESWGWLWVGPGVINERVPCPDQIALPEVTFAGQPAFTRRGLVIGHDIFLAQAEAWIEWAARARLNTIFIHTIGDQGMPLGACRLRSWQQQRNRLWPLIRERGLRLEIGGHHLTDAIPRKRFRRQPELFRFNGRRRVSDGNPCPTNPTTQALIREWVRSFFLAEPDAAVYHLWPVDRLSGGWCLCPQCAQLSPADQSLLLVNVMADELAAINPTARISFLAYHDSMARPQQIVPAANVEALIAPRMRSYAAGIGTSTHPINGPLAEQIAAIRELFPAGVSVFEYYLDGILFKSALPPLGNTIAADLRTYRDWGVTGVHALLTGDRPWLAPGPNPHTFAALAWNLHQEPSALRHQYAAIRSPANPTRLDQVYTALEEAWQQVLDITPAEVQRQHPGRRRDPISQPPRDVLDGYDIPSPYCEQRLSILHTALDSIATGEALLTPNSATPESSALAADLAEWTHSRLLLRFLAARQEVAVLQARRAPPARQQQALAAAREAHADLLDWASRYVPPAARSGHRLFRTILKLHLDHLESQIAPPWRQAQMRWRRLRELTIIFAQLWRGWLLR
ncbi:DUF4838 domain-containing protein [Chloroflexus sp.]|uniref:DUF4838 domain-containing protein n=1 Tax=Chloroflexus sp. TaxID=1904827 RepID=UPI00404A2C97